MRGPPNWRLYLFTFFLLLVACGIRSDLLVDKSFLPRVLALSLLLLITWLITFRKRIPSINTLFIGSLILLYIWSLLSAVWAISHTEAIIQSQLLFLSLITFLVITALNAHNKEFEDIFIKTQVVVLLISFGLALTKMALLKYYDPYKIVSISANKNLYCGYLLLSQTFVLAGFSRFRGFWRYLAAGVAIISLFFIIIVHSRAGYLGLITATLIALGLLLLKYRYLFTRQSLRVTIFIAIILLASVSVLYTSLDTNRRHYYLNKVLDLNYFVSYDDENLEALKRKRLEINGLTGMPEFDFAESYYEYANLRFIFWGKSFPLFLAHPLVGVGAGNWKLAVPSIPLPLNPDHTTQNFTYSQPHNELISLLTELGIIGFVFAFGVFAFPLIFVYHRLIFSPKRPPVEVVFYASFITGFYLFSFFDFPLKRVEHNVLLFSALAFMIYHVPMKFHKVLAIPGLIRKTIWLLVPILLLSTILLAVARVKGEFYTLKVFRNERRNDKEVIRYCQEAGNCFYRITPNTLPIAWFEGVAHYRLGHLQQANTCFENALQATPFEVRVLNDYGITFYGLQNTAKAKSFLWQAIALDPCFDDAKFNLAAIYYHSGQPDSALFYVNGCNDSRKKEEFLEEIKDSKDIESMR